MVWKPHVTVAAVIERNHTFLLVEEHTRNGHAFNQPAGHLEPGESIIKAVEREVNEETAWQFTPEYIVAIQLWQKKPEMPSFLRICFAGTVHSHNPEQILDDGIIDTHWLSYEQITAKQSQLRSPLVLQSIHAYQNGECYPLTLLKTYLDFIHE